MNVRLDTDRVSLIQGDSLSVLRRFADKSFDITITDPPYSPHVHEKHGKERRVDGRKPRDELTFPPMTPDLIAEVSRELVRVTRGWIIVFSDFYNSYRWGEATRAAGGEWVRTGQWVKTAPMPQMSRDRPACGVEDIVVCHAEKKRWTWNGGGHTATFRGTDEDRHPNQKPPATFRGKRDKGWPTDEDRHPNQKPLWLLQTLLGMFAPENATVLDPYFGSGGLAVAALATERIPGEVPLETTCGACAKKIIEAYAPPLPRNVSVVGVEGDPKYVDLSIARIREASPALFAA